MSDEFDLDAGLFLHVRRACSAQAVRIYLDAVLIEPHPEGGCMVVATDGHVLLAAHDAQTTAPRAALVKLEMCEWPEEDAVDEWGDPLEQPSADGARLKFTLDGDAPAVATISQKWCHDWRRGVIEEVCEASKYPDWREAVSGKVAAKAAKAPFNSHALNPDILARVVAGRAVRIAPPDHPGAPSRLHFHDRPEMCGLIMPRWATIQPPAFEAEIIEAAQAGAQDGGGAP